MNRRNFVVGLGTVATISGVASVTAASFADSVEPTADFQVIVDENLTLELGEGVPDEETELDSDDGWTDEEINFDEQDVSFEDDGEDGVVAYTDLEAGDGDEPINDDIELQVAVANDPDEVNDTTYDDFLKVVNDGIQEQNIAITYTFGDDVDEGTTGDADGGTSEGEINAEDVVDLFRFEVEDGEDDLLISPADPVDEPDEFVTVDPEDDVDIDFIVDLEDSLAEQFAEEADVEDSLFSEDEGAGDNFDLIDTLVVGVEEDDD